MTGLAVPLSADAIFAEAFSHHAAGRLDQASALYQLALSDQPDHPDSLHLLGLITAESGDPVTGADLIARAIRVKPNQAPFHNSLALALRLLGHDEAAVAEYRIALALRPESAEIHNNLATLLREQGRLREAVAHFRLASEHAPDRAEIWLNLANTLAMQGDGVETEACFRKALILRPDFPDGLAEYGRWLAADSRWVEAEKVVLAATRARPEHAPSWCNLGIVLQALNKSADAERCYRRAIEIDAALATAHTNLGCLLALHGETDAAIACHQRAIAAEPGNGAARLAACMAHLPVLYRTQDEIAGRRQDYATALDGLAAGDDAGLSEAVGTSQPFFLAYQQQDDLALQTTYGRLVCRLLGETQPLAPRPAKWERNRIGIVSGFFLDHTIWKLFLEGWLTHLDRARFTVIGFHTGPASDAVTDRAEAQCERFVRRPRAGETWRETVAREQPHVLLYPEIGMDPVAARLAAQRLAPVQCVAWGHPVTSGMPTIDYFLSSTLMEPRDADASYSEQLVRMPALGLHYQPEASQRSTVSRNELGIRPDVPVFWSGQALYKYLPCYDEIFPRIAKLVGACQFVFIGFAKSAAVTALFRQRLGSAFAAEGLDADRYCVFLPPMPQEKFIAAVGLADIVLDTIGWSGGKSTLDCLAQDPVIVAMEGRFMRGRHTAAILRQIGCEDTIALSVDDYVAMAAALARDPARRAELRRRVAQNKHRAFRDTTYIRALEAFLVQAVAAPG